MAWLAVQGAVAVTLGSNSAVAAPHDTICPFIGTDANGPRFPSSRPATASTVELARPAAVAVDNDGTVYVGSVSLRSTITAIRPDGTTEVIAGASAAGSYTVETGDDAGPGSAAAAQLNGPYDLALDTAGRLLYVVSGEGHAVRRINLNDGSITTVAGRLPKNGTFGTDFGSEDIPATQAALDVRAIAIGPDRNLYVATGYTNHYTVRRVDLTTGLIRTVVGNGLSGASADVFTPATSGPVSIPLGITFAANGAMYLSTFGGVVFRDVPVVGPGGPDYGAGTVTRIAGSYGVFGTGGDGGPALAATLPSDLRSVAFDASTNALFVAARNVHAIRRVDLTTGTIDTIAGSTKGAFADGPGAAATFATIARLATGTIGGSPALVVADFYDNRVRLVRPAATAAATTVSTLAGSGQVAISQDGSAALGAGFAVAADVAWDRRGNAYVLDRGADVVRRVAPDGTITTIAGTGERQPGTTPLPATDVAARTSPLSSPVVMTIDDNGPDPVLYVAERFLGDIYDVVRIDTAAGTMRRYAGSGNPVGNVGDNGPALAAGIRPWALAVAPNHDLYISEYEFRIIRKVVASTGIITRFAGDVSATPLDPVENASALVGPVYAYSMAFAGDQLITTTAGPTEPYIIRIDPTDGTIHRVAGAGTSFGATTGADLRFRSTPTLATDPQGRIYAAETSGDWPLHRLTFVPGAAGPYVATTVERLANFTGGPSAADGGSPLSSVVRAEAIAANGAGEVLVVDRNNISARQFAGFANEGGEFENRVRLIANNGCQRATVGTPSGNVRSASGVAISSVPTTNLPLTGASATTTALRNIDLTKTGVAASPLKSIPLKSIPLKSIPLKSITLASVPLLRDGGWDRFLVGTPLEGTPLANVTLDQVLGLGGTKVDGLQLGELDLSSTPLKSISVSAVALGSVPLKSIPLDGAATDTERVAAWNKYLAPLTLDAYGGADTATLLDLDVRGAPLKSIPLKSIPLKSIVVAGAPLKSIPLKSIDLGVSPLKSIPLTSIPLKSIDPTASPLKSIPLKSIPLKSIVVDCTLVDCQSSVLTLGDAADAGAVLPDATLGGLWAEGGGGLAGCVAEAIRRPCDLADLMNAFDASASTYLPTFGDLLLGLVARADLPWEQFPLGAMDLETLGSAGNPTTVVPISFQVQPDRVDAPLDIDVRIGQLVFAGASWDGLAVLPPAPTATDDGQGADRRLRFTIPPGAYASGPAGTPRPVTLFLSFRGGRDTGSVPVTATIGATITGGQPTTVTGTVTVADGDEPNDTAGAATPLPGDSLHLGYLSSPTDVDLFQVPAPEVPGALTTITLSHLAVDADLVVYESGVPVLRGTAATLRPINKMDDPLPVPDNELRTTGEVLSPSHPGDVPIDDASPLAGFSARRGTSDETIELVSHGQAGTYTVQVTGYRGATSSEPYVIRARTVVPPGVGSCPALDAPVVGTDDVSLPTTLGAATDTLVLVNTQRLLDIYGQAGHDQVIAALRRMASTTTLGYRAEIVPVDKAAAVRVATAAWRAAPCIVGNANGVVAAVNGLVDQLVPAARRATMRHLLLVGGDDQLPFARLTDSTKTANESTYSNEVATPSDTGADQANPLSQALGARTVLSDDPYAAFTPLVWGSEIVYPPDMAVGRLVETPADIVNQVNQFLGTLPGTSGPGRLNPTSSAVYGYDFLSDGADAVDTALGTARGASLARTLVNTDIWNASALRATLGLPTGSAPGIVDISAHFDHERILPASGNDPTLASPDADLVETRDITTSVNFSGRLFLSIGCHSGLAVPDSYVKTGRAADWAQTLTSRQAIWVANTGYGYGDDRVVAYSERLAALFAGNLTGATTVGEALRFAKQAYRATNLREVYDLKAMEEFTFYGIPMYRIGNDTAPPVAPPTTVTTADPTAGGLASASVTVTPNLVPTPVDGTTFYTDGGQPPLVADGRPIQPQTSVDVTPSDPLLEPRGAVIVGLTEQPAVEVAAAFASATVDLAAHEPATPTAGETFPSILTELGSFVAPGNRSRTTLLITDGQFSGNAVGIGRQRLFSTVKSTIYYAPSTDPDRIAPTFSSVSAVGIAGQLNVSVSVTDEAKSATGTLVPGRVNRVVLMYRDGSSWSTADLLAAPGSSTFTRSVPVTTTTIDYFVQAVDASGNVAVGSNKATFYEGNAEPVVVGTPVAPIVAAGVDLTVPVGQQVTRTVAIVDADSTRWTVIVDAGDGTAATTSTLTAPSLPLALRYATIGSFVVTVRVCDEGGRCGTSAFRVTTTRLGVRPTLLCQQTVGTTRVAFWGVVNPNRTSVSLPVGPANQFSPGSPNRLQPTTFAPGTWPVVVITSSPTNATLSWTLDGTVLTVSPTTRRCL